MTTTTLQKFIEAAHFQITGGAEYQWQSFGSHARFLDFDSSDYDVEFSVIFDSSNQEVYQSTLYVDDSVFRWTHPDFIEGFKQESYERDIDPRMADETRYFTDCEVFEDYLSKVQESFNTGTCDKSILLPIELNEDTEALLNQLPEGTDLSEFVVKALEEKIELFSKQNRDNWDIVFSTLSQSGITATIDRENAPISEENIQEIYNWINGLKVDGQSLVTADISYTDKETAQGIISTITVNKDYTPELTFSYVFRK